MLIDIALIIQIFILMTPLSSLPILVSAYNNRLNIRKIAIGALLIAFGISLIIALVGPYLFNAFGITINSFRVAGGIVLVLLGIDIIREKSEQNKKVDKIDGFISILATPVLVGPATISFITIKAYELGQVAIVINIIFAFIVLAAFLTAFLLFIKRVNVKIVSIVSRVFGLFLAALGVEMIFAGLKTIL